MSIFGKNPDYDLKCLKLFKIDDNKENTIQNLENKIQKCWKIWERLWILLVLMDINGVMTWWVLLNIIQIC